MFGLTTILLAVLTSYAEDSDRNEFFKELVTRLGLGNRFWLGMPFTGGRTVVWFPDGTKIVQLLDMHDFAVTGTSLGNFQIAGQERSDLMGERIPAMPYESQLSSSLLYRLWASDEPSAITLVYVDERNIPQAHMVIRHKSSSNPELVIFERIPLFKMRDRRGDWRPMGEVPRDLEDKILSVFLDIQPYTSNTILQIAAAVFGEKDVLGDMIRIRNRWDQDQGGPFGLNSEYNKNIMVLRYLESSEATQGERKDDLDPLLAWWEKEIREVAIDDARDLISEINELDIIDIVQFLYPEYNQIVVPPKQQNLPSGVQRSRTEMWRWKISLRDSPRRLLGKEFFDYQLQLRIFYPRLRWLRKNLIVDQSDPHGPMSKSYGRPLITWALLDHLGNRIDSVAYEEGPFPLLDRHLNLGQLVQDFASSLMEDVEVVDKETIRHWMVSIPELISPILRSPKTEEAD